MSEHASLLARIEEAERQRDEAKRQRDEEARLRQEAERRRQEAERRADAAEAASGEARDTPTLLVAAPYTAVLRRLSKLVIASPSKETQAESAFRPALAAFRWDDEPLVLRGKPPREALQKAFDGVQQYGQEKDMYSLATFCVPDCITAQGRSPGAKLNAEALFGPRNQFEVPTHVQLPLACEPELFVHVKHPGDPAFAGELKSLPKGTINEAVTYVALGMMHSCFRVSEPRGRRFHASPPVGYALVALAQCGYLLGAEWVGKLLLYPLSQPFFLGSPEHAAAVRALDTTRLRMDDVVVLPTADEGGPTWCTHPATGAPTVSWTHTPAPGNRFWKVIESEAFDGHSEGGAARLRALFRVHAAYAAALLRAAADDAAADPPPAALVAARLRYGAFALLVEMPFVGQRTAQEDHLEDGGRVLDAVAAAVGWLARRGLLYIDLRAPNVRCTDGAAAGGEQPEHTWLVDYDDMLLLHAPLSSADELVAALANDTHGGAALQAWPALEDALRNNWEPRAAA